MLVGRYHYARAQIGRRVDATHNSVAPRPSRGRGRGFAPILLVLVIISTIVISIILVVTAAAAHRPPALPAPVCQRRGRIDYGTRTAPAARTNVQGRTRGHDAAHAAGSSGMLA